LIYPEHSFIAMGYPTDDVLCSEIGLRIAFAKIKYMDFNVSINNNKFEL